VIFADHVAVEEPIAAVANKAATMAEDLIVLEIVEPTFTDHTLIKNAPSRSNAGGCACDRQQISTSAKSRQRIWGVAEVIPNDARQTIRRLLACC
jgi:hypothetical protein